MEQIIPMMKVRRNEISVGSKYQETWDLFTSYHRLTDLRREIINASLLFYTGGSMQREMTVLTHGHKLLDSNSVAIDTHFLSKSLSISTILPTSA